MSKSEDFGIVKYLGFEENACRLVILLPEHFPTHGPDQQVILRTILPIGIIETEKMLVPKKHKGLIAYAQPQSLLVSDEDRDRLLADTVNAPYIWKRDDGSGTWAVMQIWPIDLNDTFRAGFQVLGTNPDPTDFSPQAAAEFQRSLGHLFGVAPEALRPCYCRRSFVNPEPVFVGPTEALLAYFMAHPRPDLLSVSHGVAGARIVVRTVDGDGTPGEKAFDMRPGAQYALYTRLGNGQMACVTPHETFKRDRRLLTGDDLRTGAGPAVGGASEWVSRGPWQRAPGDSAQRVPADVVQALPGSAGQVLPRGSGRRVSDSLSEPPTTDPVREPPPPPRIRWRRGRQLGEGAFGTVYQALDTVSGRLMAVKTIRVRNPLADVDQYKAEVDVLQRYAHPNIVQYLGLEEGPGPAAGPQRLCIFLEYVAGGTIAALLREYGAFPERVVQRYTGQILAGLAYLHRSGVVHRDVKGANILVTDGGVIKLADFGASCRWKEVAGENPMMVGTAWYMAPEVGRLPSSPKSDIWSVGATVYEMYTRHPPHHDIREHWPVVYRTVHGDAPRLPDECRASAGGRAFLSECFQKDPARRPDTAALMAHTFMRPDLECVEGDDPDPHERLDWGPEAEPASLCSSTSSEAGTTAGHSSGWASSAMQIDASGAGQGL